MAPRSTAAGDRRPCSVMTWPPPASTRRRSPETSAPSPSSSRSGACAFTSRSRAPPWAGHGLIKRRAPSHSLRINTGLAPGRGGGGGGGPACCTSLSWAAAATELLIPVVAQYIADLILDEQHRWPAPLESPDHTRENSASRPVDRDRFKNGTMAALTRSTPRGERLGAPTQSFTPWHHVESGPIRAMRVFSTHRATLERDTWYMSAAARRRQARAYYNGEAVAAAASQRGPKPACALG